MGAPESRASSVSSVGESALQRIDVHQSAGEKVTQTGARQVALSKQAILGYRLGCGRLVRALVFLRPKPAVKTLANLFADDRQGPIRHSPPDASDHRGNHPSRAFHDHLAPETRDKLGAISRLRTFAHHTRIAEEGDETALVGNVVSGVLKLAKTLPDGRQQIVGLLLPPDMFGYTFGPANGFSIEAATDVSLCVFERPRFEALLRAAPSLERAVACAIVGQFEITREWTVLMSGSTVATRLAGFLLMQCNRWPRMTCSVSVESGCIRLSVPIDRKDLAQYLGTTVESLSRAVQEFVRTGILRVVSPSQFDVLDPAGLIARAGMPDLDTSALTLQRRHQG